MNQILNDDLIEAYGVVKGPECLEAFRELIDAFGAYITKWQNHAIRCMGKAQGKYNVPYYQGRVSLTTDIQSELYQLKLDIITQLQKTTEK